MPEHEIVIPPELLKEKSVRLLITQWRNLHLRHRECRKRVAWSHRNASKIEKRRRKEKWEIVARVLEIEHQLIRWCAKATHDPEIWMPKSGKKVSRLVKLHQKYHQNRRIAHHAYHPEKHGYKSAKAMRAGYREQRKIIVSEIRGLTRAWMSAIYLGVYPDGKPPKPLPLHPAELVPRKLKVARVKIRQELAA